MSAPIHMIDLIRKKRDRGTLSHAEIGFLVRGAAGETIPLEQLSAWLMAAWLNGLAPEEIRALTVAMRDSGAKFSPARLGKTAVDKHSTGGVGDKTSFLVAPIAAACGVAVPMISGRALGHTGGTLDKLESIPGFRTALTLAEFEAVLQQCGASIVSQTPALVPADRVLYALRDRTGTVESPGLICASILSKKLAAGLDALVLDVKTGSGAFLRNQQDAEYLAALMVSTAEAAGTRTVALLTDMGQPLGSAAGNWIELVECLGLLRGERSNSSLEPSGKKPGFATGQGSETGQGSATGHDFSRAENAAKSTGALAPEGEPTPPPSPSQQSSSSSEDLRELSLILAGWMIHLGGQAQTPQAGYARAQQALADGSALEAFLAMVTAQGGDASVFDHPQAFHHPGATQVVASWQTGYIASMDTTLLGWAVQRTGAGREKAGQPVDPHAGILFHHRRGAFVEQGQPLATLYATHAGLLAEPEALLKQAIIFADEPPEAVPLVGQIFTRRDAETYLKPGDAN